MSGASKMSLMTASASAPASTTGCALSAVMPPMATIGRLSGRAWGLKVDSVSAVVQVANEQLEATPAGWQLKGLPARWLAGLAKMGGKSVALLNVDEVLAAGALDSAAAACCGDRGQHCSW